jgi:lysophospholipase L1-like esterase
MNVNTKRILEVSVISLILALSLLVVFSESQATTSPNGKLSRIACLGDSITNMTSYPENLQTLLGNNSDVINFGFDGAAINFYSDRTYYFSDEFRDARASLPTTVIIMLGTNDARISLYDRISNFVKNYELMIRRIEINFIIKPQIFLVIPPPIFENNFNLSTNIFEKEIIPLVRQVASNQNLPLIDVYTPLVNHPEYFSDGVHPNSEASQIIAKTIYDSINSISK